MNNSSVLLAAVNAEIALTEALKKEMDVLRAENESLKIKLETSEFIINDRRAAFEKMKKIHIDYKESVKSIVNRHILLGFKTQRIRREVGASTTIRDLKRQFKNWRDENHGTRSSPDKHTVSDEELETLLFAEYGPPADGETFQHIQLFYDEDDVKQFDSEKRMGE